MNMTGEQRVAAPRQQVWEALNDPQVLRASLPGCQSLDKEADDRFTATMEVKVGPIGARFKGTVSLTDLNPPQGYTLVLQGNAGITGTVKGSAKVQLREDAGNTIISYDVDADVAGRLAQLGGPLLDATAKQLAGKFFSRFGEIVGGTAQAASPIGSSSTSAERGTRVSSGRSLLAWVLSTAVAALAGFFIGRGRVAESDWAGLSMGLLVILVAAAAFEYGRRAAAPE
jgi:carbon monoxide dehydrogenase subunit G